MLLATYLNDHLAGATAGSAIAQRTAGSNRGSEYGPPLAELAREIKEDRQKLIEIMKRLDVGRDRLKVGAAWTGEKLGRLKPNGRLLSYSPLSRLVELEILSLGIQGKLGMWLALDATVATDGRLAGVDLEELIRRARSQRRRAETLRLKAAAEAFGPEA
jgi:hypothetical protein